MRINASRIDRTLRVLLALVVMAAGFYYQSLWGLVGIVPLVSGITGFCPLYAVFGMSTCHYEINDNEAKSLRLKNRL